MSTMTKEEDRMEVQPEALEMFFQVVLPVLDERQRRLVAGATARMLAGTSVNRIAQAAGMSRSTVVGGIDDIAKGATEPGRVRARGAGRKQVIESQPGLLEALDELIEPLGRTGSAVRMRWTDKSAAKLAEELEAKGFVVSPDKVGQLLKASGFAPKTPTGAGWTERAVAAQFRHIVNEASARLAADEPVVSARISRKLGAVQRPPTDDHTAPGEAANGIYALGGAEGWTPLGEEEDAAALAVQAVRRWWQTMGIDRYPAATRLMIIPCAGGAARRSAAWTAQFGRLAVETGLELTICHHPPGMVRWTHLEHRLFSFVTDNRPGHPLVSYRTVVELGAGTIDAPLKERAELEEGPGAPEAVFEDGAATAAGEAGLATDDGDDGYEGHNYVIRPRGAMSSNCSPPLAVSTG